MKRHYLYFCLLLVFAAKAQQDPQYSLYQFNPLLINPAYAGARDVLSVAASVRSQWVGFDGAPKTTALSVHSPVLNKNLGVGLTVISDKLGPRNNIGVYANVAYILKLNRSLKLSFGLNAGYSKYQLNLSTLTFNSAEVPSGLVAIQNKGVLDLNGGMYLKGSSFFVGLSATHLTGPSIYDYTDPASNSYKYNLASHLFLTAGKSFIINNNVVFAPTVLIKKIKSTTTADLNLNFLLYKKLWLGVFYRSGYGPGALLQYYVTNKLKVGYSYDTGLKDARRLGGSHEVMIGFDFSGSKAKTFNPRFL